MAGAIVCTGCAPGSYNATGGAVMCGACAPNTFSAISGALSCGLCPSGMSAAPGSISCVGTELLIPPLLSVSLSLSCLSVCLSIYLSICLVSLSVFLSICLSFYPSAFLSCLSLVSLSLSICLSSVCLVSLFVCLSEPNWFLMLQQPSPTGRCSVATPLAPVGVPCASVRPPMPLSGLCRSPTTHRSSLLHPLSDQTVPSTSARKRAHSTPSSRMEPHVGKWSLRLARTARVPLLPPFLRLALCILVTGA